MQATGGLGYAARPCTRPNAVQVKAVGLEAKSRVVELCLPASSSR
jgi:hypothetical protein